jgi:FKBP-type peptidyl-prolyl cis-trans isomerase FkpA
MEAPRKKGRAGRKGNQNMTRNGALALLLGATAVVGGCQKKQAAPAATASPAAGMTEDEKAVYALGAAMGQQAAPSVKALNLSPAEMEVLKKAFAASLAGEKSEYTLEQYGQKLQARAEAHASKAAAGEKERSAAFRESAAVEPGAVKTASGLVYKTLKAGSGSSPKATDTVQCNYRGTLMDGKEFDASARHGGPATFQLNQVIPCWSEGVQRMKVGERAKLVCPSEIAYGDRGTPDGSIPPGATLVFEVELLGIKGR